MVFLEYRTITYTIEIAAVNGKKFEVVKEEIIYNTSIKYLESGAKILGET